MRGGPTAPRAGVRGGECDRGFGPRGLRRWKRLLRRTALELPSGLAHDGDGLWGRWGHDRRLMAIRSTPANEREADVVRVWEGPGWVCARAPLGPLLHGRNDISALRYRGSLPHPLGRRLWQRE